ncbi:hypothetical protein SDC9_182059 [bioreactor metagenome]|uniref:Uncharacterized protein n=1 Tax=bioreactor metagenome TaxID=1076179 RepID=A0A645H6F6_9ZZZZ
MVMNELESLLRIESRGAEKHRTLADLAKQIGLRQRRSLIRKSWFVIEQHDTPDEPLLTKGDGNLHTAVACPHDHDRFN